MLLLIKVKVTTFIFFTKSSFAYQNKFEALGYNLSCIKINCYLSVVLSIDHSHSLFPVIAI